MSGDPMHHDPTLATGSPRANGSRKLLLATVNRMRSPKNVLEPPISRKAQALDMVPCQPVVALSWP